MALIKCAECGTEISDKAAACVKCGAPTSDGVVTTQQTGKPPKVAQLVGFALLAVGMVMAVADAKSGQGAMNGAGPTIMGIGLALYIVGRVSAWWRHG